MNRTAAHEERWWWGFRRSYARHRILRAPATRAAWPDGTSRLAIDYYWPKVATLLGDMEA